MRVFVTPLRSFLPSLGVAAVAVVTLLSGVMHGWMSHRWGPSAAMAAAAAKLAEMPDQFGSWRRESRMTLHKEIVDTLECSAYVAGVYVNRETGEKASLALILGPAGPISVHTPEICYSSLDYTIRESRQRIQIKDSPDEFWALRLQAANPTGENLRVYYGWSTGGPWSAANDPRFGYAGHPYLYKLQLAVAMSAGGDTQSSDPCQKLLHDFLPVARRYLVLPAHDTSPADERD